MNRKDLYNGFNEVDDDILERSETAAKSKKKPMWLKWGALAACICLVIAITPTILRTFRSESDLKALEQSEIFLYEGIQYYIIGNDDAPKHYGFPAEITEELAGEHAAFLARSENEKLIETEKKTNIELFEYAPDPCTAAKILRYGDTWYCVIFIGAVSDDIEQLNGSAQLDMEVLYRIYDIKSGSDITAIHINSNAGNSADHFYTTDAKYIEDFYAHTVNLVSCSVDEFEQRIYKNCKTETERQAVDNEIKKDFRQLRIQTENGLILHLQIYPTMGWMRSVSANAHYELTDETISWYKNIDANW